MARLYTIVLVAIAALLAASAVASAQELLNESANLVALLPDATNVDTSRGKDQVALVSDGEGAVRV